MLTAFAILLGIIAVATLLAVMAAIGFGIVFIVWMLTSAARLESGNPLLDACAHGDWPRDDGEGRL